MIYEDVEGSSLVAVKTLKESAGDQEREELLKELEVMKSLRPHPNIVTLLGCCTDKGNVPKIPTVQQLSPTTMIGMVVAIK